MSLMPFYLTIVVHAGGITNPNALAETTPWELAIIPLINYAFSIGTSLALESLGSKFSRKVLFMAGMFAVMLGCIPMIFLTQDSFFVMYPIAAIFGIGFSLLLTNSTGFMTDFIGPYGSSGAFVYGSMSLFDKLIVGVALVVIMSAGDINDEMYLRYAVPGISLAAGAAAWLMTLFIRNIKEGKDVEDSVELGKIN